MMRLVEQANNYLTLYCGFARFSEVAPFGAHEWELGILQLTPALVTNNCFHSVRPAAVLERWADRLFPSVQ